MLLPRSLYLAAGPVLSIPAIACLVPLLMAGFSRLAGG